MFPVLVAFPALALVGALAGLALAARRPRARARRILAALGEPVGELDQHAPGETTLDGVLGFEEDAPGELTTVVPPWTQASEMPVLGARTEGPSGAHVSVLRRLVRLEGSIQILVGSREGPGGARVLRAGDRVRVRGRLHVVASDTSEGGYRQGSAAFCLAPPADEEWKARPIPMAFLGAPPVGRRVPALVGALVATAGFAVLLAATPGRHGSGGTAARARPACAAEIGDLLDHSRLGAARDRLADCADPLTSARAHWMLGEVEEASRAYVEARAAYPELDPTVTEVEAHALGGRPERAAEVVNLMASTWYRGPDTVERRRLICIADAFAARAEPAAQARLQATYDAPRVWPARPELECALLLADLKSDEQGRTWALQTPDDKRQLAALLYAEARSPGECCKRELILDDRYPLPGLSDPRGFLFRRPLGLEKSLAERAPGTPLGAESAAEVALFYAVMGDRPRVAAMLETIPPEGSLGRSTYIVAAIAATDAEQYPAAARFLQLGYSDSNATAAIRQDIHMLRGEPLEGYPNIEASEGWSPNRELFAAGRSGDGEALAGELDRLHTDGRMTVLRVLPHVTRRREALRRWLEERYPAPSAGSGLAVLAESTGTRLVLARALGDRALEDQLTPIAGTLTDAMLDRRWALPFLLLETFVH